MFHVKRDHELIEKMTSQVSVWGIEISSERAVLLASYAELLATYEEANVIGADNVEEIIHEHILDSLSCVLFRGLATAENIVDVGSGGGLPGIPIGATFPETRMTLVESTAKKVKFLEYAVHSLGMKNMEFVNRRVEEVGRSESHRDRYDIATSRALAPLDVLAEYCLPLIRVGGHVLAMKGGIEEKEVEYGKIAAKKLGGFISEIIKVRRLPEFGQKQRNLVVIEKVEETPDEYPRRIGIPTKKPLGGTRNG